MNNVEDISIRTAGPEDLPVLFDVCRKAYTESFASHWNPGGLEWYLNKVYSLDSIGADLNDPHIRYFIASLNGDPIGFMKLKLNADLEGHPGSALEVDKIYFRANQQRRGIGKILMETAFLTAKDLDKEIIWLAVIDTNHAAFNFYKKIGFVEFDRVRLELPYFKDELRGMFRMVKEL